LRIFGVFGTVVVDDDDDDDGDDDALVGSGGGGGDGDIIDGRGRGFHVCPRSALLTIVLGEAR